jgi:hypothetical protein
LSMNGQVIDDFMVMPEKRELRKLRLTAAQLGDAETIDLKFSTDKTFVPALQPASNSKDPRELGIRIFHAFVEPAA